jgi:hypothetical protein
MNKTLRAHRSESISRQYGNFDSIWDSIIDIQLAIRKTPILHSLCISRRLHLLNEVTNSWRSQSEVLWSCDCHSGGTNTQSFQGEPGELPSNDISGLSSIMTRKRGRSPPVSRISDVYRTLHDGSRVEANRRDDLKPAGELGSTPAIDGEAGENSTTLWQP